MSPVLDSSGRSVTPAQDGLAGSCYHIRFTKQPLRGFRGSEKTPALSALAFVALFGALAGDVFPFLR